MNTINIKDEALNGDILNEITLKFQEEYISVSELIKARVTEEVEKYLQNADTYKKGLVQPSNLETRLNNKKQPKIDVEKQVYVALDAFQNNGFFILVDDEQVESLDQKILVDKATTVSFVKLTPLVGG